jgi:hypothetical protein
MWVADWLEAASDVAAMAVARTLKVAVICEVWERDRLVGTIDNPRGGPAPSEPAVG